MNKKIIIAVIIIGAIGFFSVTLLWKSSAPASITKTPDVVDDLVEYGGEVQNNPMPVAPTNADQSVDEQPVVKEFSMNSFVEFVDEQPKPQFSLREIMVNKGDKVRIKITNIRGNHDFKLDEFGVYAETPLDQEVVVEFTADKVGEFVYYCSKPGHRAAGQWGTLKVLE